MMLVSDDVTLDLFCFWQLVRSRLLLSLSSDILTISVQILVGAGTMGLVVESICNLIRIFDGMSLSSSSSARW